MIPDWYWAAATGFVFVVLFLVPEIIAVRNGTPGDTYSEFIWRHWVYPQPGHPLYRYRRFTRIALVFGFVWLGIHLTTGGWY